ncbi:hypothetical protein GUY60_04325 [Streptomyces sp. YC537]|uniref:Integral membrane protein n=1 Tax=Streptomyces boluensis TaxID=1775135 RepID=A0A964XIW1_9ACTN|nr:hypothetical protein [Streptomyces boluensis]NBE50664.1 hypothetical protein [Streptomyces boluensis]
MRAVFVLSCLVAVVAAVLLGRAAWADGERSAVEVARHRHLVTGTTVSETNYQTGGDQSSVPASAATATWHFPASRAHTETVPVPAGTRDGDRVQVWVDDEGREAGPPPDRGDTTLYAVEVGVGTLAGTVLAGGALVVVRLRLLDARSAREWEREWARIEPHWSGRLRPGQGADDDGPDPPHLNP